MSGELPSVDEIIATHDEIVEEFDLTHGDVDVVYPERKLRDFLDEVGEHTGDFERAAKILRDLPTLHVFEDGNKRTAWITVIDYLDRHDLEPAKTGEEVERVLKRRKRFEIDELSAWLKTGEIEEEKLV